MIIKKKHRRNAMVIGGLLAVSLLSVGFSSFVIGGSLSGSADADINVGVGEVENNTSFIDQGGSFPSNEPFFCFSSYGFVYDGQYGLTTVGVYNLRIKLSELRKEQTANLKLKFIFGNAEGYDSSLISTDYLSFKGISYALSSNPDFGENPTGYIAVDASNCQSELNSSKELTTVANLTNTEILTDARAYCYIKLEYQFSVASKEAYDTIYAEELITGQTLFSLKTYMEA